MTHPPDEYEPASNGESSLKMLYRELNWCIELNWQQQNSDHKWDGHLKIENWVGILAPSILPGANCDEQQQQKDANFGWEKRVHS